MRIEWRILSAARVFSCTPSTQHPKLYLYLLDDVKEEDRRKWIRKDIRIIHEIYSCVCVCRQEAGILMHNKFKRIDGIFAVAAAAFPYASGGLCDWDNILCCGKKHSSHEIKSKQNCAIDGCPSVYRVEGGREGIVFLDALLLLFFFVRLYGFLSVCCTVIAGPQIFRLLQLKYLFVIWFCNMDKPAAPSLP